MKLEKNANQIQVRYCWNCDSIIFYDHFLQINSNEDRDMLNKLWNNPFIRILCCDCYQNHSNNLNEIQLEIKCFIEGKIGRHEYNYHFGLINTKYLEKEFHDIIPNKGINFSITKGKTKMEKLFRKKFNYNIWVYWTSAIRLNSFFPKESLLLIKRILQQDTELIIELPDDLAQIIISSPSHDFKAILAPLNMDEKLNCRFNSCLNTSLLLHNNS